MDDYTAETFVNRDDPIPVVFGRYYLL